MFFSPSSRDSPEPIAGRDRGIRRAASVWPSARLNFPHREILVASMQNPSRGFQNSSLMMVMTSYRARIYACCNSILIALERPQSSSWLFLSLMVRAGYVCVAIIYRTLTWTTGSLSCAQMRLYTGVYGHRKRVCIESWLWKGNPLPHWGIERASAAWRSDALTSWATFHPSRRKGPYNEAWSLGPMTFVS